MPKIMRYRQGDVMFHAISAVPEGKTAKRESGIVAHGEVTGHAHKVADLEAAEVLEIGDGLYVRVSAEGGVSIQHEEHGAVTLPRGDYAVTIQREYTPEEIRNVAD